jgi:DNA mismatch endonuclease, patch repair protein
MPDVFSAEVRSKMMGRIRGKDTEPEKIVRSYLHTKGLRFRIHRKDLPGNPDIVLPKYNTVVFIQGCFWHNHSKPKCSHSKIPKSNSEFWKKKFVKNVNRDENNQKELLNYGWNVEVVWECEINVENLKILVKAIQSNI